MYLFDGIVLGLDCNCGIDAIIVQVYVFLLIF